MVCDLTGLDVANASLLDEATAAAEAMALCQRAAKSKATAFFVDRDCHPQTIARDPHPRRAARLEGRSSAIPSPTSTRRRSSARSSSIPAPTATCHDFAGRSPRLHAAGALACVAADPLALTLLKPPGEMGADIAVGSHPALRRAARLRRPARRLHGGQGRAQALDARPHRRRLGRRPRQPRLPPVAADPRAAHPPREGDLERLHRAGAARGHGVDVCGLPRPRGPQGDRPAHPPQDRAARQGPRDRSASRSSRTGFFDTITVEVGALQGVILKAAVAEGINLRKVGDDQDRHHASTSAPGREHTQAVWRAFGGDMLDRDLDHEYRLPEDLVRDQRLPDPPDLPHEPGRGGDDALHAPARRPRPGARPGDDPARLLHDEAQRHRRDDGRSPGPSSPTSTRSCRRTRPRATPR